MSQSDPSAWIQRAGRFLREKREFFTLLVLSLGLGGIVFLYLYGYYPLVFSNLAWIYNGQDALQHFLGWQFFRAAPWSFPLGTISSYGYPYGVTLAYTDSIPLAALFLKLFNPLLQSRFQYLGAWTLLCLVMQCLFALLILREFTSSRLNQLLGALLLIFSPPLLYRAFYHTSLVSQWLILLAIFLVLLGRRRTVSNAWWGLVCALAVTIHPYFLPMVLLLYLVSLAERLQRGQRLLPLLGGLAVIAVISFLAAEVVGLFALGTSDLASSGFGTYSFNLNALYNPLRTSQFLAALPLFHDHQEEGYNYLGLGNLLLMGAFLVSLLVQGGRLPLLRRNRFLIIAGLGLVLFSASGTLTFNDRVLFKIELPASLQNLTGMFRSSGRFFWPVFYLLVLGGMARLLKNVSFTRFLLGAALILQILDLQPLIEGKRFHSFDQYQSPLVSEFWKSAPNALRHIMILPAVKQTNMYAPLAIFAANHGLTLNWGYFARARYPEIQAYGEKEVQNLAEGRSSPDTLYVFCQMDLAQQVVSSPANRLEFYRTDYYVMGYDRDNSLASPSTAWANDRLTPPQIANTTLKNYLASLQDTQIVILAGKGQPFETLDSETFSQLHTQGLETSFDPISTASYLAVFGKPVGGKGIEILSDDPIEWNLLKEKMLNGNHLPFDLSLKSAGLLVGNYASISLNGKEYAPNKAGLNLVRYDLSNGEIQSIAFTRGYQVVCP